MLRVRPDNVLVWQVTEAEVQPAMPNVVISG